jgi:hypothetical protein
MSIQLLQVWILLIELLSSIDKTTGLLIYHGDNLGEAIKNTQVFMETQISGLWEERFAIGPLQEILFLIDRFLFRGQKKMQEGKSPLFWTEKKTIGESKPQEWFLFDFLFLCKCSKTARTRSWPINLLCAEMAGDYPGIPKVNIYVSVEQNSVDMWLVITTHTLFLTVISF